MPIKYQSINHQLCAPHPIWFLVQGAEKMDMLKFRTVQLAMTKAANRRNSAVDESPGGTSHLTPGDSGSIGCEPHDFFSWVMFSIEAPVSWDFDEFWWILTHHGASIRFIPPPGLLVASSRPPARYGATWWWTASTWWIGTNLQETWAVWPI